jgi:hypothetical protein
MATLDLVVDTPNDPEFLKQFACASMLHAHLDNTLKMFVRSFDKATIEEALEYIGYQGAAKLRKRVARLAMEQLGDGEALTMILGFMKRCEEISERRNDLLHSPIARERDGETFHMRARRGNTWVELPKPEALEALANETFKLVQEMNHQRLSGVIDLALRQAQTGLPNPPPQEPVCDWCKNQGIMPDGRPCPVCEGKGTRIPRD